MLPDFFGAESENGRDEAQESMSDAVDRGLRRAAAATLGCEGVQAIFENVEVKRAEIDDREIVNGVEDAVEVEGIVRIAALAHDFAGAMEHPGVDFEEVWVGHRVEDRIE